MKCPIPPNWLASSLPCVTRINRSQLHTDLADYSSQLLSVDQIITPEGCSIFVFSSYASDDGKWSTFLKTAELYSYNSVLLGAQTLNSMENFTFSPLNLLSCS